MKELKLNLDVQLDLLKFSNEILKYTRNHDYSAQDMQDLAKTYAEKIIDAVKLNIVKFGL